MATIVGLRREKRTIMTKEHQVVEVVDGQQRITSIGRFVTNKFAILENGNPKNFDSLPADQQARKLSPEMRERLKLVLPEEAIPEKTEDNGKPRQRRPAESWTCPECGKEMITRQKGLHVARHKKEAKKTEK